MDKEIRILTLNLFLRPPGICTNASDHKDLRTSYFLHNISRDFDIICLQEVFSTLSNRKDLIKATAKSQGFLYSYENPRPNPLYGQFTDGGLLILSKLPITECDSITYSN